MVCANIMSAPILRLSRHWIGLRGAFIFAIALASNCAIAQDVDVSIILSELRMHAEKAVSNVLDETIVTKIPGIYCPEIGGKGKSLSCDASPKLAVLGRPTIQLGAPEDLMRARYSFGADFSVSSTILRETFKAWTKTILPDTLQCGAFQYWGHKGGWVAISIETNNRKYCEPGNADLISVRQITLSFYRGKS
jgi:hypothetical protein